MGSTRRSQSSLGDSLFDAAELGVIKIAVFDANTLFRVGIIHVLTAQPGVEIVVESGSASEVLRLSRDLSPDIVILDADLIAVNRNLCHSIIGLCPAIKILVMAFN